MTKKERFKRAIAYLKGEEIIRYNQEIADKMNANKNTLSLALKGEEKYLTEKFIHRFCLAFEQFNYDWLEKGTGEMLKIERASNQSIQKNSKERQSTYLNDMVQFQKETISSQKEMIDYQNQALKEKDHTIKELSITITRQSKIINSQHLAIVELQRANGIYNSDESSSKAMGD